MATTERPVSRRGLLLGVAAGVAVGVPLTLLLRAHGPGDMWRGFLGGAVLALAAAVVGIAALPLTGLATVALAVGAGMLAVMGTLLGVELAILVGAFAVVSRRS